MHRRDRAAAAYNNIGQSTVVGREIREVCRTRSAWYPVPDVVWRSHIFPLARRVEASNCWINRELGLYSSSRHVERMRVGIDQRAEAARHCVDHVRHTQ